MEPGTPFGSFLSFGVGFFFLGSLDLSPLGVTRAIILLPISHPIKPGEL